ncbi:NADPH:quinone reductase [Halocalculus aciditolerans]|uniref:NADPH:quinone reductase n=1 Tax=Halocalculus aciditolerans TaxID=1383812 RepID=A0A830FJC8_9EURY|nr:NADPH:quinone reductase [Halocalculus aciditolerans]GGL52657.1 NADPH:quinone reductase [Halocalculus aciditolerans]
MRAVRYHEHGGPEVLQVDDVPTPEPGPGEVRIAVEAAGVNPVDTYFREGAYAPPALPMIPGSDVAGVVDAVGDDATRFEPGDRVFGTGLGNDRQGTYAEEVLAPEDRLAALPDGVSFVEGAAVALVGVTAWRALFDHGDLNPAETCLVHGGSGGVGHVAVQLADAAGARVTTTASEAYHRRLPEFGANAILDYARDDLAEAVVDAGNPDVVLDHKLDHYLQFDADVAAEGARVVGIGEDDPAVGFDAVGAARSKDVEFHFMSMYNTPDFAGVLESLATLMADGLLVPDVHDTYALDEAADAQRDVLDASFFGKLVVDV